jgi:hypothetical protein
MSIALSAASATAVEFTCLGLPKGVSCSFTKPAAAAGSSTVSTRLNISTQRVARAAAKTARSDTPAALGFGAMGLVGVVLTGWSRRRARLLPAGLVVLLLLSLAACGGGSLGNTEMGSAAAASSSEEASQGTYTFTIAATAPNFQRSATATLVIE